MTLYKRFCKRSFDIVFSFLGLVLFSPLILTGYVIASISTKKSGFFKQQRVGRGGKYFNVIKLRTMRDIPGIDATATAKTDPRITKGGAFLRAFKLDELPQLRNVLAGDMSIVGPRPDVPGFADKLTGDDRVILSVRPGITGPATLKYKNEEEILAKRENPETYSRDVIWPDKVKINREYVENYSFFKDIYYIFKTIIS
ncbi:MAG: sugar transferase [Candidatus Aminicenantes bacterium]|nr:sugar transferase [Candidatus Aminicenantes bacterium]